MIDDSLLLSLFLAAERRRRDEGWTDLGLDQLDRGNTNHILNATSFNANAAGTEQGGSSQNYQDQS